MAKKLIKKDNALMFSALFILVISILIAWGFFYINKYENNPGRVLEIIGKATLTIYYGGSEKRFFEGEIVENETLADILKQASKAGNFSYVLDEKSNVIAINGLKNIGEKSWRLYINDKKISELSGKIIIKNNDNVFIKYE